MTRREIREHKFRMLFSCQYYAGEETEGRLSHYFSMSDYEDGEGEVALSSLDGEEREGIASAVGDMLRQLPELDAAINAVAEGWTTQRMASTDLNILRLAIYEILYEENIPTGVAVNEAVELAKRYGGEESGSFVNGILGRFVRKEEKAARTQADPVPGLALPQDGEDATSSKEAALPKESGSLPEAGARTSGNAPKEGSGRGKAGKGELHTARRDGKKLQILLHGRERRDGKRRRDG